MCIVGRVHCAVNIYLCCAHVWHTFLVLWLESKFNISSCGLSSCQIGVFLNGTLHDFHWIDFLCISLLGDYFFCALSAVVVVGHP